MKRVLVVDDDRDIREALEQILESAGYQVEAAENGVAALERARRRRPDVIVLDLMMPVMDGWKFREEQKRDPALAHIPVIVISAATQKTPIDGTSFLAKPFDLDRLLSEVERCTRPPTSPPARAMH